MMSALLYVDLSDDDNVGGENAKPASHLPHILGYNWTYYVLQSLLHAKLNFKKVSRPSHIQN